MGHHGPLRLGIDTGGTCTDAALVAGDGKLVASAKAPTTHDRLLTGVVTALDAVLTHAHTLGVVIADIGTVALSTTLATNAMVEGTGAGTGLILIGFATEDTARIDGLDRAAEVVQVAGGHDAHGRPLRDLDTQAIEMAVERLSGLEAIAVAGMFAVRNDQHETAVRSQLGAMAATSGIPVTCSHTLSGALNGPRRAATALANARLTAPLRRLLDAFADGVAGAGIDARLLVVRSDGSVMSLSEAFDRPVETILSGPAASLLGGVHLAGTGDAVVIDIGGTTTDVAVVTGGVPELVDDGAVVGGVATMVRSPSITTRGLGGDSDVAWNEDDERLRLGPGRVIPVAVAAAAHPEIVELLERQRSRRPLSDTDGLFCLAGDGRLIEASQTYRTRRELMTARRHAASGHLSFVGLTPTDAAIVLGLADPSSMAMPIDTAAAGLALAGFARCLTRLGRERFTDAHAAARAIVAEVQTRCGMIVADAIGVPGDVWAASQQDSGVYRVAVELDRPIVGVGASAQLYHPPLGAMFRTGVVIPLGSEVANAVGAAVGSVRLRETSIITPTKQGDFILHRPGAPGSFDALEVAVHEGADRLRRLLLSRYVDSGLRTPGEPEPDVEVRRHDNIVDVGGSELFVETTLEAVLFIASVLPGTAVPTRSSDST